MLPGSSLLEKGEGIFAKLNNTANCAQRVSFKVSFFGKLKRVNWFVLGWTYEYLNWKWSGQIRGLARCLVIWKSSMPLLFNCWVLKLDYFPSKFLLNILDYEKYTMRKVSEIKTIKKRILFSLWGGILDVVVIYKASL